MISTARQHDERIERARAVSIEAEIARRGHQLRRQSRELVGPCPRCGGTDRFSIHVAKKCWNCRVCKPAGITGDVIGLVQWLDRCEFAAAIETLTGEVRPPARPIDQAVRRQQAADPAETLRYAERIWNASAPIAGTPGAAYLAGRGILLDDVPEHGGLRFHPRCPWESGTAPCIVSRFTDATTGEPRGIHRRPITGAKPRTLGPMGSAVIRLWPDAEVTTGLVLGEGVETTLAAATRMTHRGTLLRPAWAAGCALSIERFPVLSGIECLTLLVDPDESNTGQNAAAKCAQRWREAGREVIRLIPNKVGTDFNDMV
jgi:phage/plasmid primase-like uncharacterized protein